MERCLLLSLRVSTIACLSGGVAESSGTNFTILYRYCQGGELFHFILERKHLNEREAAMIMYQLLSALVYLHS